MTPYKRGDVVLVAFPFTDLTTTKVRPAIVISSEKLNRKYNDIVIIAITSQIPKKSLKKNSSYPPKIKSLPACQGNPWSSLQKLPLSIKD